jgi:pyrroloquinoline-quinone synthase
MADANSAEVLAALDQLIERHHLLKHPFYRAWTAGRLSREELALYAAQYYQHVLAFPRNLGRLAARAEGDLRALAVENLAEELDPTNPHPALWRSFARAVGAQGDALESARPLPGIAALLETFEEFSKQGSVAQAAAAFYAYEAQVPEIAAQKMAGLRRFYGITEPQALLYFSVHEEADVRHRARWRSWLAAQPELDAVAVLGAAERALRALWGALDAVYPEGCAKN